MQPDEALNMLRGPTTREFLFNTIVSPASRTVGVGNFAIALNPRANADVHDMFRITEAANLHGGHQFQAVSVPMRNRDTLAAGVDGLQLPNNGPDVMVTGQLTNCSFMYSTDKNNMYCAHIEPTRAANPTRINRGLELGVALTTTGETFSNDAGGVKYFTWVDYQTVHHVNIFGVRRNDGWSLYVQGIATDAGHRIAFAKTLL